MSRRSQILGGYKRIIKNSARSELKLTKNGVTLEMVAIPGGTFQMGSPSTEKGRSNAEGPQHCQ